MHNTLLDSARASGQEAYKLERVQALQVFFLQPGLKFGEIHRGYI